MSQPRGNGVSPLPVLLQPGRRAMPPVDVSRPPRLQAGGVQLHARFGDVGVIAPRGEPLDHFLQVGGPTGGVVLMAVVGHDRPLHEDVGREVGRQEARAAQDDLALPPFCRRGRRFDFEQFISINNTLPKHTQFLWSDWV